MCMSLTHSDEHLKNKLPLLGNSCHVYRNVNDQNMDCTTERGRELCARGQLNPITQLHFVLPHIWCSELFSNKFTGAKQSRIIHAIMSDSQKLIYLHWTAALQYNIHICNSSVFEPSTNSADNYYIWTPGVRLHKRINHAEATRKSRHPAHSPVHIHNIPVHTTSTHITT